MTFIAGSGRLGPGVPLDLDPLPPPPPPPTGPVDSCGITDTFTRTVFGGWGTSDSGAVWVTEWGSAPSVNGAGGVLTGYGEVRLGGLTTLVQNGKVEVRFDVTIAGAGVTRGFEFYLGPMYFYLEGGTHNDAFLQRFGGPSSISQWDTVTDFGFATTDGLYHVHAMVDATTSHASFWKAGETEPAGWMCASTATNPYDLIGTNWGAGWTVTDWTSFFFGGMASSETITLDNLDITGVNRCTYVPPFDTFTRTVAGSWGTSDTGYAWSERSVNMDPDEYGVEGGSGWVSAPSTGGRQGWFDLLPQSSSPWVSSAFSFTCRFRIIGALGSVIKFTLDGSETYDNWYFWAKNDSPGDNVTVETGGDSPSYKKTDWALNTWYIAEGTADNAGGATFRVYAEGSTPPEPLVASGPVNIAADCKFTVGFQWIQTNSRAEIDYIDFASPG